MNRQLARLAVAAVVLIAALIVATTYWQTWAAPALADRQDNAIQKVAEFTVKRGRIFAGDGKTVLATNVRRRIKGKTFYFRRYPQRSLAAHLIGYSTQYRERAGLEQSLNDYLTGANTNFATVLDTTVDRLSGATIEGNDVVLTLNVRAQRVAVRALGNRCGAVVALDPRNGRVLVLASSPSYDLNLVERNFRRVQRAPQAGCAPSAPLLDRAQAGLYAPGSTFKVVTGAAALDSRRYSLASTFIDLGFCIEYGKRVNNYDTSSPFGLVNFLTAMQYSINSVFCNIGKDLGGITILRKARRFGFYSRPELETPGEEQRASGLYRRGRLFWPRRDFDVDPGRLAFGQERLGVTPLQMAMIAAAVANRGVLMQPTVVARVVAPDGGIVTRTKPKAAGRALSAGAAAQLTAAMRAVVAGGTGTAAAISGVPVAGKTGTAETGRSGVNTTSFVAFAPADRPRVAIAVMLENQAGGTGGTTAAPVAKLVMEALLGVAANS